MEEYFVWMTTRQIKPGTLAEFERDMIHERTRAGLEAARARGHMGGRPKALPAHKIAQAKKLYKQKTTPVKVICQSLGISRTTFYRYVTEEKPQEEG